MMFKLPPSGLTILPPLAPAQLSYAKFRQAGLSIMNASILGMLRQLSKAGGWFNDQDQPAEVFLCHHLGRPRIKKPYAAGESYRFCDVGRWHDPGCCPAIISRIQVPETFSDEDFKRMIYSKIQPRPLRAWPQPITVLYGNGQYVQLSPVVGEIGPQHPWRKVIEDHFGGRGIDHLKEPECYEWHNPWRGSAGIDPAIKDAIDECSRIGGIAPPHRRKPTVSVQSIGRRLLTQKAATGGKSPRDPARAFTPDWRRLAPRSRSPHDRQRQG